MNLFHGHIHLCSSAYLSLHWITTCVGRGTAFQDVVGVGCEDAYQEFEFSL